MTIELSILIAVGGFALSVGTFFVGRMTAAKTSGFEDGELKSDVKHIKASVDDVKRKMEQSDKRYIDLEKRVTALEERMHIYHEGGHGA